jgi:hypothetical protein
VRHGSAGGSDVFAGGDASQRCPEDQFCRGQQCGGLRAGRPFVGDGQSSCVSRSKRNGPMSGLWAASRCAAVARFGPHSAAMIGGENISTEMALPISTARSRSPVALASASSAPKTGSTPGSTTRWADARTGRPAGRRGVAHVPEGWPRPLQARMESLDQSYADRLPDALPPCVRQGRHLTRAAEAVPDRLPIGLVRRRSVQRQA